MKKNLFGAIVILFVAFACFLAIQEIYTEKSISDFEERYAIDE
jgi:hypothetical protein